MDIRELKVNNIVKCKVSNDARHYRVLIIDGRFHKVMLDAPRWGFWYEENKLTPIKLTNEVLNSLGFFAEMVKRGYCYRHKDTDENSDLYLESEDGKKWYLCFHDEKGFCKFKSIRFKYAHELQNMWHSYTGEIIYDIQK